MQGKGCKHTVSTSIATRPDVQEFIRGHMQRLNSGYTPENFKKQNGCPTNNSHRNSAAGQITTNDRYCTKYLSPFITYHIPKPLNRSLQD